MDVLATCQSAAKALLFTVHRHNFQFSSKRDGFRIYQQVAQPYNRKAEEQLEPAQVALWLFIITILSFAFCVNWHRQDTGTTTNPQIKCHNKFILIPWPTGGVLKQHLGRAMQVGMQTLQSSVHVRASPSLLCCTGLHRHHLPLCFGVQQQGRELKHVWYCASITGLCYLNRDARLVQHRRPKN